MIGWPRKTLERKEFVVACGHAVMLEIYSSGKLAEPRKLTMICDACAEERRISRNKAAADEILAIMNAGLALPPIDPDPVYDRYSGHARDKAMAAIRTCCEVGAESPFFPGSNAVEGFRYLLRETRARSWVDDWRAADDAGYKYLLWGAMRAERGPVKNPLD